jgi:hypothetical protein
MYNCDSLHLVQPMDLETIEARAAAGAYASIEEGGGDAAALRRDMAQIWRACEVLGTGECRVFVCCLREYR